MLGHCLRHWPNIQPTFSQHVVFSGRRRGGGGWRGHLRSLRDRKNIWPGRWGTSRTSVSSLKHFDTHCCTLSYVRAIMVPSPNDVLMLLQRLRHRPSIETPLYKHIVLAGYISLVSPCWKRNVIPQPNQRRWTNFGLKLDKRPRRWSKLNPPLCQDDEQDDKSEQLLDTALIDWHTLEVRLVIHMKLWRCARAMNTFRILHIRLSYPKTRYYPLGTRRCCNVEST